LALRWWPQALTARRQAPSRVSRRRVWALRSKVQSRAGQVALAPLPRPQALAGQHKEQWWLAGTPPARAKPSTKAHKPPRLKWTNVDLRPSSKGIAQRDDCYACSLPHPSQHDQLAHRAANRFFTIRRSSSPASGVPQGTRDWKSLWLFSIFDHGEGHGQAHTERSQNTSASAS
jgi:hypothetical protein